MKKSLTKTERLKRKHDLDRVFKNGIRTSTNGSRLLVLENGFEGNRFAVCPVRKYGNAVARNRAKRVCREAYRELKLELDTGLDVVMVVYPGRDQMPERSAQLQELTVRAGIRRSNG